MEGFSEKWKKRRLFDAFLIKKLSLFSINSPNHAKLKNIHPGEVLKEQFLNELNISAYRLAKDTGIPQTRVSQIIKSKRRITADTALRLSKYFGNSEKFWLSLQDDYDREEEKNAKEKELGQIKHYTSAA